MLAFRSRNRLVAFTLLPVILLMLFINCSKSGLKRSSSISDPEFLRGTIEGIPFECTRNIHASRPNSQTSDTFVDIYGEWLSNSIRLWINENGGPELKPGIYNFQADKDRTAVLDYGGPEPYRLDPCDTPACPFPFTYGIGKVYITQINENNVRGNFQFITNPYSRSGVYLGSKKVIGEFFTFRN